MWHQWFNLNFMEQHEWFVCKKNNLPLYLQNTNLQCMFTRAPRYIHEIKAASRCPIFHLVKKRNKETLVPIIKKHVKRQRLVASDELRAYACLSEEAYRHVRVDHNRNYVDPQTGLHTQNTETTWQTYKREVWHMRGNHSEKALKKTALLHRMDLLVSKKIKTWSTWKGSLRHKEL